MPRCRNGGVGHFPIRIRKTTVTRSLFESSGIVGVLECVSLPLTIVTVQLVTIERRSTVSSAGRGRRHARMQYVFPVRSLCWPRGQPLRNECRSMACASFTLSNLVYSVTNRIDCSEQLRTVCPDTCARAKLETPLNGCPGRTDRPREQAAFSLTHSANGTYEHNNSTEVHLVLQLAKSPCRLLCAPSGPTTNRPTRPSD